MLHEHYNGNNKCYNYVTAKKASLRSDSLTSLMTICYICITKNQAVYIYIT